MSMSPLNKAQNFESTLEHFGNQYHSLEPMILESTLLRLVTLPITMENLPLVLVPQDTNTITLSCATQVTFSVILLFKGSLQPL
jgi:hypothetical protein